MKDNRLLSQDEQADVVVVGYGGAGALAALAAHDAAAKVMILEKGVYPGGSTVLAGGSVKIALDVEGVVRYLSASQGGRCSEDLVRVMAQGMYEIPRYMEELAKVNGAKLNIRKDKERVGVDSYPFPGWDSLGSIVITQLPGFNGFSWVQGCNPPGPKLVKLLSDNIASRDIDVRFSTTVKELVQDGQGRINGVRAEHNGKTISIKARKAVILASGGFEFNERLKAESFEAYPVYSMGHLPNTGEGLLMAQKAGAALWHMWHFHGSYGFKFSEYPVAFRTLLSGPRIPSKKIAWINVDRFGKRFMNEYQPAPQDTMHRPLQLFDPDLPGFPRIPCYLVFGDEGRPLGPIAKPMTTEADYIYDWSEDNSREIEKGWIISSKTIKGLADKIGVDTANLTQTIKGWNKICQKGEDLDFKRPPGTMMPIETPPYYAMQAWPICTNTQGGPVHDVKQRVLDPYGNPIPRLYAVGELGSFYGHVYLLGGNLAECFVGGRIAGQAAAEEKAL